MNTSKAISRNYEKVQSMIAGEIARILSDTEEAGKTTLLWWAYVLDHAEDAASLCRACFEGGETCDGCEEKARERMAENWEPTDREIYGQ